jgi:hypothetical protein
MHRYSYRWRSRPDAAAQERNIDQLRSVIIELRREVATKTQYASRLEFLLRERLTRIDVLTSKLEQARAANQRLDQECERLVAMVQLSPF